MRESGESFTGGTYEVGVYTPLSGEKLIYVEIFSPEQSAEVCLGPDDAERMAALLTGCVEAIRRGSDHEKTTD